MCGKTVRAMRENATVEEAGGDAGVEEGPGRPSLKTQCRLRLLQSQALSGLLSGEHIKHPELHGGHDGAGDPEPQEELQHVVRIRD